MEENGTFIEQWLVTGAVPPKVLICTLCALLGNIYVPFWP